MRRARVEARDVPVHAGAAERRAGLGTGQLARVMVERLLGDVR